jgi:serine/threonine-protein kinase RsbT
VNDDEQRLRIATEADAALAVLAARDVAVRLGMGPNPGAALATAVSELATNVVKYARFGWITLRTVRRGQRPGIEVVVEDRGPGIADIDLAMTDHHSTGGTLGLGLPGTRRLVDEFEITSEVGVGTRVRVLKWS